MASDDEDLASRCSQRNPSSMPRVSIGLPVRNGERSLARLLTSIEVQTYGNYEVVIADNASSDATEGICREFQQRDPRFRYVRNERDLGQIENFNHVFRRSRGEYFRWVGADDWFEPKYLERCVETLDAHPGAVGATSLWQLVDDEGSTQFRKYPGPRCDSPDVQNRLGRLLWFLQADRLFFDPIYSMLRRDALERTRLLLVDPWTDRILATELCILGPFCHIDELLCSRRDAREAPETRLKRYHSAYSRGSDSVSAARLAPLWTMYRGIAGVVLGSSLDSADKRRCVSVVAAHWLRAELARPSKRVLGAVKRRLPGLDSFTKRIAQRPGETARTDKDYD